MRLVFQLPASITSVIDAPWLVNSLASPTRPECAVTRRSTPSFTNRTPKLALHLIVDNSSTHTTDAIRNFLAAHPRFHLHFTPTSASWLNAVET